MLERPADPRGHFKRYRRRIREAALRATGAEMARIDDIDRDRRRGTLTLTQANAALRGILRDQNERTVKFSREQRLRELGFDDYAEYLLSPHWRKTRERYYADEHTIKECLCGETEGLQLHHKTYVRLGEERLEDLRPLCKRCHNDVHVLARRGEMKLDLRDYVSPARAKAYAEQQAERKLLEEARITDAERAEDLQRQRDALITRARSVRDREKSDHFTDDRRRREAGRFAQDVHQVAIHGDAQTLMILEAIVDAVFARDVTISAVRPRINALRVDHQQQQWPDSGRSRAA